MTPGHRRLPGPGAGGRAGFRRTGRAPRTPLRLPPFYVSQEDDLFLHVWKGIDGALRQRARLGGHEPRVRPGGRRGGPMAWPLRSSSGKKRAGSTVGPSSSPPATRTAACAPPVARACVPGWRGCGNPGAQGGAALETGDALQHREPGLLHHLLGERGAVHEGQRDAEHGGVVAAHNLEKGRLVAAAESGDERRAPSGRTAASPICAADYTLRGEGAGPNERES